ncbi:MAG: phosphomannomutase/phosphoglucomutase [Alphaproteobacteria bacterium]|nr:phosphomannomutase/phosphoglucomutase [Alphaproteobacteria bacterium]
MSQHRFDPTILREYDIRGVVGKTLGPADARAIGRGFGTFVAQGGGRRVAVGYDGRLSSPELEAALIEGLTAAGIDVTRIGLGPTPMLYYAVYTLGVDGGIMISGSHNPPEYNGFKMMMGHASFFGEDIKRLGALAAAGDFASGKGAVTERPVLDDYVARILADFEPGRALKVAWDAGNGSTGRAMEMVTAKLPGTHILLNARIDGTFPAHHPDPTVPKYLEQLIQTVKAEQCDLGIAFDGDGDRIGVIDAEGHILWGDQLMVLLATDVLAGKPGATIIADVKASQTLFDSIAKLGGQPLMWRTGHSLIKAKMKEIGAPLAGEMSGHIFFADRYYGYDDALYAAVRLLRSLARSERSLAAMRAALPQLVSTPELRFPCSDTRKFPVITEVRDRLKAAGARMNDIDGVRVMTDDGWWLLRASNTQDVLVARCEAKDAAGLSRLKAALAAEVRRSGIEPPAF